MIKEYEFCKRCGRKLRSPEARKIGYGKICEKKSRQQNKQKKLI